VQLWFSRVHLVPSCSHCSSNGRSRTRATNLFSARDSRRFNVASETPAAAAASGSVMPSMKRSVNAMRSFEGSVSSVRYVSRSARRASDDGGSR